jgi:hypothetical protein
MTGGEATSAFEGAGWAIREVSSGEVVGQAGRYAIRSDKKLLRDETVFELLDEYGVPAGISDVTPGKAPMVPRRRRRAPETRDTPPARCDHGRGMENTREG